MAKIPFNLKNIEVPMEKKRSYAVWTGASICCLILFICIGIQTSKAPLVSHTIMTHGNMVYMDDFVDSEG